MTVSILCLVLVSSSASESDWTDGPGLLSPTPVWNRGFAWSSSTEWRTAGMLYPEPFIPDSSSIDVDPTIRAFCAGDFDCDGDPDLVAKVSDALVLFENADGEGAVWLQHILDVSLPDAYAGMPTCLAAADLDGDGDEDLSIAYGYDDVFPPEDDWGRLCWLENPAVGGGDWVVHLISSSVFVPGRLYAVDLDSDGSMDLVEYHHHTVEMGGGEWLDYQRTDWFDNVGGTWTRQEIPGAPATISFGDIDSDGDPDLVYAYSNHARCLLNNLPSPFTMVTLCTTYENVSCVTLGDRNLDGLVDVLVCGDQGDVRWFLNNGAPGSTWPCEQVANELRMVSAAGCLDMDGDGDLDIVGMQLWNETERSYNQWRAVSWLDGGGGWFRVEISGSSGPAIAHWGFLRADMDGDGTQNTVFYQNPVGRGISWFDEPATPDSCSLISAVLSLRCRAIWDAAALQWEADIPTGSWIRVRARASTDPLLLGPWSDPIPAGASLSGLLPDSATFLQYLLEIGPCTGGAIPAFHGISFSWDAAAETGHSILPLGLSAVSPSRGMLELTVEGTFMDVSVDIYDIAGRRVHSSDLSLGQEPETMEVGGLVPGLYFCRAESGPFEASARGLLLP